MRNKDTIYTSPLAEIADFAFDRTVANVFADMINRSVPGYGLVVDQIGVLARHYAQPNSRLYDLGCSLGAATLSMRHRVTADGCQIVAVDNAAAMIARCQEYIDKDPAVLPVQTVCEDLRQTTISNASVVVMNYTLQFIAPQERGALIQKIYEGLLPGGVFILAEKVLEDSAEQEQLFQTLHADFKRAQGYSDIEISQKRAALENVLVSESVSDHQHRLQAAGFRHSAVWFHCYNFAALLAVK
ncbi:MAG: carboxy-S-adenosyl-L-methionine synthase CmoA [Gammaproteobacteria bacterium]